MAAYFLCLLCLFLYVFVFLLKKANEAVQRVCVCLLVCGICLRLGSLALVDERVEPSKKTNKQANKEPNKQTTIQSRGR